MDFSELQEEAIKKKFKQIEAELVAVYAQLAEKTLEAHNGWMRYEVANRMANSYANERSQVIQQLNEHCLTLDADGNIVHIQLLAIQNASKI